MATEDFVVGQQDREPEEDKTGIYPAHLVDLQLVAKSDERIDQEVAKWGKERDKVDKYQLFWDFLIDGLEEPMRQFTGSFFGEKAKATDTAGALLGHRPSKTERVTRSQLVGNACQVWIEFNPETMRNRIAKVTPPKVTAAATKPSESRQKVTAGQSEPLPPEPEDDEIPF